MVLAHIIVLSRGGLQVDDINLDLILLFNECINKFSTRSRGGAYMSSENALH